MSRRKQTLTAVKDLSPLPDLIPAAKRIRRGAADRSREKVRSYVRMLQRDGVVPDQQKGVSPRLVHNEPANLCYGTKRQPSKGDHGDVKRSVGQRAKRTRSSSPAQLVTITIRDDEPGSSSASQQEMRGRRSGRQYAVVDYSKLHFGSVSEPEEEEDPSEERNWQASVRTSSQGSRRGRPAKSSSAEDQLPTTQKGGPANEGTGIFVCRRCNVGHETVDDFLVHFEVAHCPDLTDEEFRQRLYNSSYLCKRCDYHTTNKDDLERHEVQHAQQPNPLITKWRGRYHCDRCEFSATNSVTLSHHQKTHQKSVLTTEGGAKSGEGIAFACAECMARFADRQDVLRHQEQVHGRGSLR